MLPWLVIKKRMLFQDDAGFKPIDGVKEVTLENVYLNV